MNSSSPVPAALPERLGQLVRRLAEAEDLRSGLEAVAWCCDGVFAFYRVALVLPGRKPGRMQVVAAWARRPEEELEGFDFDLHRHPLETAVQDGVPVVRTDPLGDHPHSPLTRLYRDERKREEMGVPLHLGGRRGLLVFASEQHGEFRPELFPWLEDLAYLLAVWVRPWLGHELPFIAEQQYQALLDGALDGIVVLVEGRAAYSNASFREILGLPLQREYRGAVVELLAEDSRAAFADALAWLDEQPRVLPRLEVDGRRADGTTLHLEVGLQSIAYLGQPAALIQVHNATERTERERAVRDAVDRTDALLHTLAHDIRGPVGAVEDFSGLLRRRGEDLGAAERADAVAVIHRAGASLRCLVEGLLEFSALGVCDAGLGEVEIEPVFRSVEQELGRQIRACGAQIEYRRIPPVVSGRTPEVGRLFRNLFDNALRYSVAGVPPRIRVSGEGEEGDHYVFCVEDNGIGVEPQRREEIFTLFGRGDAGGAGVGLAVVQRVAQGYGGRVWVRGAAGGGSRFYFTLPKPLAAAG